MVLDDACRRLAGNMQILLDRKKNESVRLASMLDTMSPLKVLSRGYAIAEDAARNALKTVRAVSPGDLITICLADGRIQAKAETITEESQ